MNITHDIAELSTAFRTLDGIDSKILDIQNRCNALSADVAHRDDQATASALMGAAIQLRVACAAIADARSEIVAAEANMARRVTQ